MTGQPKGGGGLAAPVPPEGGDGLAAPGVAAPALAHDRGVQDWPDVAAPSMAEGSQYLDAFLFYFAQRRWLSYPAAASHAWWACTALPKCPRRICTACPATSPGGDVPSQEPKETK